MSESGGASELRILAEPTRARILQLIIAAPGGRQLVGQLATELGLRQPTVSHHMKVLVESGLLDRVPEGRRVWYSIAEAEADRIAEVLPAGAVPARTPPGVSADVLERISADLSTRFSGTFSPETVRRYVAESHELLAEQAHVVRHLPSLTARFAADRLDALAQQAHVGGHRVPEVLFVCVQNAGRSQMAAGILRHLAGDRVGVRSAGSAPVAAVRSSIITALDEIGVTVAGEFPKPLTDEVVRAADVVVTMGCGDACPVYPGRRYLDWALPDPVGLPLERVRAIRDDIESRVRELLASL